MQLGDAILLVEHRDHSGNNWPRDNTPLLTYALKGDWHRSLSVGNPENGFGLVLDGVRDMRSRRIPIQQGVEPATTDH